MILKAASLALMLLLRPSAGAEQAAEINDQEVFTFPAEFEKHDFVWIAWSDEAYLSVKPTDRVTLQMIKELAPFVRIKLVVDTSRQMRRVKRLLQQNGVPENRIVFMVLRKGDRWFRDMGPIFLK